MMCILVAILVAISGIVTPDPVATGTADCTSARIHAVGYDSNKQNMYRLTVEGVNDKRGVFGDRVFKRIHIPNDGYVHNWVFEVVAPDGSSQFTGGGFVGPCGRHH